MLKNKYKKILICSALIAAISIPLVGCGSEETDNSTKVEDKQESTDNTSTDNATTGSENKSEGTGEKGSEEKANLEVTKEMEEATTKKLKENPNVENVTYDVKDKDVNIKIQVKDGTDKEAAEGLVKIAMEQLSDESAGKTGKGDSLGELWNQYNLKAEVVSGENTKIVSGQKEAGKDNQLSFEK